MKLEQIGELKLKGNANPFQDYNLGNRKDILDLIDA
jgi:hypothetical protein